MSCPEAATPMTQRTRNNAILQTPPPFTTANHEGDQEIWKDVDSHASSLPTWKRMMRLDTIVSASTFLCVRSLTVIQSLHKFRLTYNNDISLVMTESNCALNALGWEERVQIVRDHFVQKGYRVHSGLQFGCELVLYADDPGRVHSDFCVHVVRPGKGFWMRIHTCVCVCVCIGVCVCVCIGVCVCVCLCLCSYS